MFYIYTCIFVYLLLFFSFYVKLVIWFKIKYISYIHVLIDIQEYDTSDSRKICFLIYIFSWWCSSDLIKSFEPLTMIATPHLIRCYEWMWVKFYVIIILRHKHVQQSGCLLGSQDSLLQIQCIGNFGMGLQAPSLLNTALVFLECRGSSVFVSTKLNLHLLVPLRHYGIYIRSPRECILKP